MFQSWTPCFTDGRRSRPVIRFVGEGSTYWTHVWIVAHASLHSLPIAWLDSPSSTGAASHHYWNDAEIEVEGDLASGLCVTGSTHEIRSSEIEVESHATGGVGYGAIFGSGPFDVSVQGSTLTARDTAASLINVGVVYLSSASGFLPPCNAARLSIEGSRLVGSVESGDVIGIQHAEDQRQPRQDREQRRARRVEHQQHRHPPRPRRTATG